MSFIKVSLTTIIGILTFTALLSARPAPATAQPAVEQIGITTGVVNNNVRSNLGSMDSRTGLRVSLYTDVRLTRSIFTSAEFGYVQRGYHEDMEFVQHDGSEQGYRTDLVTGRASTGHLLLGLSANFERKLLDQTWYLGAGPRMEWLTSRENASFESDIFDEVVESELLDFLDDTSLGISASAGLRNLAFGPATLRLELRYDYDLTDAMSDYPRTYRNHGFAFTVGLGLRP
ncbi:MAG: outer membrane beta-barrel protein [Cyclonatronaceae bacterium]